MTWLRLLAATLWMMILAMVERDLPIEEVITPTWERYNRFALERRKRFPSACRRLDIARDESLMLSERFDLIARGRST